MCSTLTAAFGFHRLESIKVRRRVFVCFAVGSAVELLRNAAILQDHRYFVTLQVKGEREERTVSETGQQQFDGGKPSVK